MVAFRQHHRAGDHRSRVTVRRRAWRDRKGCATKVRFRADVRFIRPASSGLALVRKTSASGVRGARSERCATQSEFARDHARNRRLSRTCSTHARDRVCRPIGGYGFTVKLAMAQLPDTACVGDRSDSSKAQWSSRIGQPDHTRTCLSLVRPGHVDGTSQLAGVGPKTRWFLTQTCPLRAAASSRRCRAPRQGCLPDIDFED